MYGKSWDSSFGMSMGWTVGFISWQGQDFSVLHNVQTGSGVHTASYPMDAGGCFPMGWSSKSAMLTTHHYLIPKSRMVELYLHSPTYLHGMVFNELSIGTSPFF
jgi:hypothetical protein